ncbi:MAG: N-acetylmuramoyl-L-alanine amidase [Bacteroidetes bacterium]|nr:N-acetylmuramoyl-L-alanine amidase [Bacteroidota bacterium]
MNKRFSIFLIVFTSLIGVSSTPKVTPESNSLTNFNKTISFAAGAYLFGIKTVVIDAGHGGKDPGCLGITTSQEKDIALGIALKLGKYIQEKIPDVKVVYTRSTDVFIELDERAAIANKNKADLFICIHCNTACSYIKKTKQKICNEEIFGTETYVMGLHKTNANLNVAKRENESILLEKNYQKRYDGFDPNSETGYILLTMQQNAYLKQSLNFASKIQKNVKEKAGRIDKGVQQAGFLVLWRTTMPSVLIETEFLSNTQSENFASSEKGQDNMARAIFSAFRQYKDEVEGKLVKYEDDIETAPPFIPQKDSSKIKEPEGKGQGITEPKKDSVQIRKEPIIENEIEIAPKDTFPKNKMLPPVKIDSAKKSEVIIKKDSANNGQLTTGNEQIIYKVQFMSAGTRVPLLSDKFKGLKDVGEYQDGAFYKYTAGEFKTIEQAMKYRSEMQSKGFKDCFVVKFKDGKRMKN